MKSLDLLSKIYAGQVTLEITGGELRARAPRGILTPALRAEIAASKGELIEGLGNGVFPDSTLPDDLFIPGLDTGEAIARCIDGQRISLEHKPLALNFQ